MQTVADVATWLMQIAPLSLSESWDNTGLLLGDRRNKVQRLMTCLTASANVVEEAIAEQVDLVVAHHPLPFRAVKQITADSHDGNLLWQLASHRISLYSPHTAWDSAGQGINQQLAELLQLNQIRPIIPAASQSGATDCSGTGRLGETATPRTIDSIVDLLRAKIAGCRIRGVRTSLPIRTIAIACGSGGSLLEAAIAANCDLFLTGEATYHACLEAEAAGIHLVMIGHFASERFAMQNLAAMAGKQFPLITTWAARAERDPVVVL